MFARRPHRVQWLTDNRSIFAAHKTIEIALALNLEPCLTPVESPESNGMAEAFVKTLKRDYVRITAPDIHWQKIRTNNPLERIMREIRRRTLGVMGESW